MGRIGVSGFGLTTDQEVLDEMAQNGADVESDFDSTVFVLANTLLADRTEDQIYLC